MAEVIESPASGDQILRFHKAERMMHWSIAVPFMICYTTALVLVVFYNPDPSRPHREVFSWIHRISGLVLMTLPMLAVVRNLGKYKLHLHNIKEAWLWSFEDIKWLTLMGLSVINKNIKLPDEGKFNAGEKLNFMVVMTTYPIFGLTGVAIWLTSGAGLPWLIHFVIAAVVTPLMLGHIFMATINPASRTGLSGMITGFVDREWARHHYRKWFRQGFDPRGNRLVDHDSPTGEYRIPVVPPKRRVWLERLAMFFAGFLLPLLFVLGGLVASRGDAREIRFLNEVQTLRSSAARDAKPVPGGSLARGARVVIATAGVAWTRVTDVRGRAGFVETRTLAAERPRYAPAASPFPDCTSDTAGNCESLSRGHLEDCKLDCREIDDPNCAEKCEDRYYECLEACQAQR